VAQSYHYKSKLVDVDLVLDESPPRRIATTLDALKILKPIYRTLRPDREHLVILGLSQDKKFLAWDVFSGWHNGVQVTRRDLTFAAGDMRAYGVILSHNHPGGKLQPSKKERWIVARARAWLRELEITVLDHIILAAPFGVPAFQQRTWSDTETEKLRDLVEARAPLRRMARTLSRTEEEVKARAAEMEWLLPGQKLYK